MNKSGVSQLRRLGIDESFQEGIHRPRAAISGYPASTVASPHLFKKVAVAGVHPDSTAVGRRVHSGSLDLFLTRRAFKTGSKKYSYCGGLIIAQKFGPPVGIRPAPSTRKPKSL